MAWEAGKTGTKQDEADYQERHKDELAAHREQEELYAGCREFMAFASGRAAQARKSRNEPRAAEWDAAAECVKGGQWPISRVVASDPGITRFQSIRTKFLYKGATKRLGG